MALGELKNGIGPDAYAIYQQVLAAVVKRDHPVGSLYISENPTSPAELYGGTWERIEGRFIMGASDTYPAGSTGGSATHTITQEEAAAYTWMGMDRPAATINIKFLEGSDYGISMNASSVAMNILNPYYSMYIWRRVA
nr:MAG TPA: baseplate protein [Caudoviricetes sp.]